MKKIFIHFFLTFYIISIQAQVLNVPQVIQEQSEWCWAGVTKSVLSYYGYSKSQCDIAEYARQVITWHNFGTTSCCTNPSVGCNYWNYNWGYSGSIQDILIHFGNIENYGYADALSLSQISTEVTAGRPFIIRWGWYSGGGHFVVGHGLNGNNVNYMDPWYGEGLHISTYNWLVDDGNHIWTSTNVITTNLSNGIDNIDEVELSVFPNPVENNLNVKADFKIENLRILNSFGQVVFADSYSEKNILIDISMFEFGVYFIEIVSGEKKYIRKYIKN